MKNLHCAGQTYVEYLFMIAIVIVVLFVFLGNNGYFRNSLEDAVETSVRSLESETGRIFR